MLPQLDKDGDFNSWKRQVDAFFVLKNVDEDKKKLAILPGLVSADILKLAPWDGHATFSTAMSLLEKAFDTLTRPQDPIRSFEAIQGSSNVRELSMEVKKLGKFINASEEAMVRKLISLVPYPLQMAAHQFITDFSKITVNKLTDHLEGLPVPESALNCMAASTKHYSERKFVCFNCDREGHISRNCSRPISRCTFCGGKHLSKFCRQRKDAKMVGSSTSNGKSLTIDVIVRENKIKALVDTGSPSSFVSRSLLHDVELRRVSKISYRSVNGEDFYVDRSGTLEFEWNGNSFQQDFGVLNGMSFPMLLGLDFLRNNSFVIDLGSEAIKCCSNYVCGIVPVQELLINDKLPKVEIAKLNRLSKEFSDIFSTKSTTCVTNLVKHKIELTEERPIKSRPFQQPHAMKLHVRKAITEMLQQGIIRESTSPWSSPFFMAKKKDGTFRFVVDYRKLNEKTISDCFPIPLVDDLLGQFHNKKYFSVLDLKSGYWQIPLEEDSKPRTAFVADNNLYEFNVMPFGLKNAPATFQRLLQSLFKDIGILPYLDDIVVASGTSNEHVATLRSVFWKLRNSGLKLSAKKCKLGYYEVSYLGHIVSRSGLKPDIANVECIKNFRRPNTRNEYHIAVSPIIFRDT